MKIKYYLRGLGTGIIFTTIVLMIIYSYRTTDSKTIERARELGMVMQGEVSDKETENDTGEQNTGDEKEQGTTGETETGGGDENNTGEADTNDNENNTEESGANETDTKESSTDSETNDRTNSSETGIGEQQTNEPQSEENTTANNQIDVGSEVVITISTGMYSESVSQKLYEFGVVDNASDFNSYLVQNGYAGKIKTGTYTLRTGMSYAEVAAVIAR